MSISACPVNGCDLRGNPIDEKHFDPALHDKDPRRHADAIARYGKCFCMPYGNLPPEERFFSKVIGVELGEVYDGVCYWACPVCGSAWHRFAENDPRRATIDKLAAKEQRVVHAA
jgi:hypothetical protein